MKTATLEKLQRAKVDGAWSAYDSERRHGGTDHMHYRDLIEEYLYQLGVLEGLKRADAMLQAQRREVRS